jgi:hypothetical protein
MRIGSLRSRCRRNNIDRIEAALHQLADLVAGDPPVCEVARVMRMPSSHNTKDGAWTEVTITSFDPDRRYELDDLEEWFSEQSPVMLRKKRERGKSVGETDDAFDFFERYAKEHGIKPPIDVEKRLAAMMYMGSEETSIHQTQLSVSAALLSRGTPVDDVVEILMEATRRAAGEYGARWKWEREKKKIRGMCATWLKKHPPLKVTVESAADVGAAPDAKQDARGGQTKTGADAAANAASAPQDKTGNAALAELNEKYFVAKEGGKIWVITFEKERNRLIASYMRFSDFSNLYMNRLVQITDKDGNTKSVELGKWWLKNRHRRQCDGLVFEPGNPQTVIDNRFNLWRGWGVEPKRGNWKRMRRHIWKVLASGDKERFKYIMRWLAWTVQHPDQRAEVALVFKGKRGTGKGTLGNCMMVLFGQHSHQVSNSKHLTGNFNAHMRDVCFLFGDECYWPGEKQAEGTIKRMITEPTLFVEGKGRDGITVPNFLHVMLASNEDWVVPAGENERRYFMNQVSEVRMQDHAWFKAIDEQLGNGGYEAMLFDLMHYKLGDWHPRQVPKSNGLLEQQARSLSPLDSWWVELLEIGTLAGTNPSGRPDRAVSNKFPFIIATSQGTQSNSPFDVVLTKREVIRQGLYDQARSIEPRLRNYANDHVLGDYLRKRGCDNTKKVMRRQGWTFPPLSELRAAWVQRFPGWPWRDPDLKAWRREEQDDGYDPDDPDRPLDAEETRLRQATEETARTAADTERRARDEEIPF